MDVTELAEAIGSTGYTDAEVIGDRTIQLTVRPRNSSRTYVARVEVIETVEV